MRGRRNSPSFFSPINYDKLRLIMETICASYGDQFSISSLCNRCGLNKQGLGRYINYLRNTGAIDVFCTTGNSPLTYTNVYLRHFCEEEIEDFIDIIMINEHDVRD